MIKIIDGKRYNTETATKLGHWWNGYSCTDFYTCSETLYQTKKGQFFLYGESGPMGKYSRSVGNMTSGGEGIYLLSESDASQWCEDKLDSDGWPDCFEVKEG